MRLVAIILILLASAACAAALEFDITPRGTIYADDIITVRTVLPAFSYLTLKVTNGTIEQSFKHSGNMMTFKIRPHGAGPLTFQPEGVAQPPITLNVQPDIARSSENVAEIFKKQRAAGRPQVILRAIPNKTRVYLGERVDIRYTFTYPQDEAIGLSVKVPGMTDTGYFTKLTGSGGQLVTEQGTTWSFFAEKPGTIEIRPQFAIDYDRTMLRWSNAVTIEVVAPPPAAARLPIGTFTLTCSQQPFGFWPVIRAELRGQASAAKAKAPELEETPLVPVVIIPQQSNDPTVRVWDFEVHGEIGSVLPALTMRYFDPVLEQVGVLGCKEKTIQHHQRYLKQDQTASAEEEPAPPRRRARPRPMNVPEVEIKWLELAALVLAGVGLALIANAAR